MLVEKNILNVRRFQLPSLHKKTYAELLRENESLKRQIERRDATIEELTQKVLFDSLTGLRRREVFLEMLSHECYRAKREKTSLALIMLDVDHFKRLNDKHGHHCGDLALQGLGHLILSSHRESDVSGRLGGEELAIFLPQTNLDNGLNIAHKLMSSIRNMEIKQDSGNVIKITASFGLGLFDPMKETPEEFRNRVDMALYVAKNSGRNQFALA